MDAFNDPTVTEIVLMASAQVGKTESFINNKVGYSIHMDPAPMLIIQPTLEMAQTWSKDRLAPMLRDTPVLQGLVKDARSKQSANTILHKTFPGGHITMAGANSAASLASRPVRDVLLDEVDKFEDSAGVMGDPVSLAKKRTTTYIFRKIGICSTPTIKGASRIEFAYENSDQRKYYVPCPHCDEMQILLWANVKWEEGKPETTRYACDHCGCLLTDADKLRMVIRGEWRAHAPFKGTAGFHINELYSPWVTWQAMVEDFLVKKKLPETLKQFINESLGETWEEKGDTVEVDPLMSRREYYPAEIPANVLVLTASVDVQADRLEIGWQGWGIDEEGWGICRMVIPGDPTSREVWDDLDRLIDKPFKHESGIEMKASCVTIDSGFLTEMVYQFCKKRQPGRVYATKGSSERGKALLSKMTNNNKLGVRLFIIGTDTGKEIIYGRLKIPDPGPGHCHFPMSYDEDYFDQLTAEQCVTRFNKGVLRRVWELKKGKKRNEALDIFVGNYAAMKILNPDFEYLAKKMNEKIENNDTEKLPVEKPASKHKIRSRKKGWMSSWK